MKHLASILLLLLPLAMRGQVGSVPAAKYQIQSTGGTAPNFTVTGLVYDEQAKYDGTSFTIGDRVYVLDGADAYECAITAISTATSSQLNCTLNDLSGTLSSLPTGQAAILRRTTTQNYEYGIAGLREDLRWAIERAFRLKVDVASGGGGGGDNLGNHVAGQNLNMSGFAIVNAVGVTSAGMTGSPAVYANGVFRVATTTVTTTTTLNGTHATLAVNCTGGGVSLNLPAIASDKYGWTYTIIRIDNTTNTLTVNGDFVDGATTFTITGRQSITVTCFSDNWRTNF